MQREKIIDNNNKRNPTLRDAVVRGNKTYYTHNITIEYYKVVSQKRTINGSKKKKNVVTCDYSIRMNSIFK